MTRTHAAFLSACKAISASYRRPFIGPVHFLKDIKALANLKGRGTYNETEYQEKAQVLRIKHKMAIQKASNTIESRS